MKKSAIVIFAFLILFSTLFVHFTSASIDSALTNTANQLEQNIQDTEQGIQKTESFLTQEEVRKEYLKKEWTKLLETKPIFKQIIGGYKKVSPYSDPIIEFLIGMTPQLSLLFALVVVIWFTLVKYYYTFYQALKDLALFSDSTNVIIYVFAFIIFISVQLFQSISVFLANKIVALIELALNPWIQLLFWLVAATVFILLSRFSKKAVALLRLYRMKKKQKDLGKRQEEATKKVEKMAEAVSGSITGNSTNGWDVKLSNGQGGWFRNKTDADKYLRGQ